MAHHHITDTGINYSRMYRMNAKDRKIEKYCLEDGEVLVSGRGTPIKVPVVEDLPMTCIPSVNFIAIWMGKMIRGTYLKLFLKSPAGTQMPESLRRVWRQHDEHKLSGCRFACDPGTALSKQRTR